MEQIQAIIDIVVSYIPVALTVVGTFSVIASATPNKVDDRIAQVIMDVINFLGANLNKAKNDPNA